MCVRRETFQLSSNSAGVGTKSYGSITENAETIRNRQAVAMGWYTTVPASFMLDLGTSAKLRLIGVPDDVIEKMRPPLPINPCFTTR